MSLQGDYGDPERAKIIHYFRLYSQQHLRAILQIHNSVDLRDYLLQHLQRYDLNTHLLANEIITLACTPSLERSEAYDNQIPDSPRSLLIYISAPSTDFSLYRISAIIACLSIIDTYATTMLSYSMTIRWLIDFSAPDSSYQALHRAAMSKPDYFQADLGLWFANDEDIWTSPHGPIVALGTKGLLSVACRIQTTSQAIASSYGNIHSNTAWRLLWALQSVKNVYEEIFLAGFYDAITIDDDMVDLLAVLPELALDTWLGREAPDALHVLSQLQDLQRYYAHYLTPTCNINALYAPNSVPTGVTCADLMIPQAQMVLPAEASALMDFYLIPQQHPEQIFSSLQQHFQQHGFTDLQIQQLYTGVPVYTKRDHPFVHNVLQALTQVYPYDPVLLPLATHHYPLALLQTNTFTPVVIIQPEPRPANHLVSLTEQLSSIEAAATHIAYLVNQITAF